MPTTIDPVVVQQAAEWMARLWSGEASDKDRAACAAWRAAHPDHEQAWQRFGRFESKLRSIPAGVASRALRVPAQAHHAAQSADGAPAGHDGHPGHSGHVGQSRHAGQGARRRALGLLGLGVAMGGAACLARNSSGWQLAAADYSTGTGEVRDVTLPDGTQLALASASAIDVRFSATERLIVLRAGEILLTTAHDAAAVPRPLRVRSGQGTLQALGTRFTVRQHGEATRVAVLEGAVQVRPGQSVDGAGARVDAGQGANFSARRVERLYAVQDSAAAWSRGLLVADGMRLDDFLAELARYRRGIVQCDPAVAALLVSGVFSLRDTGRALDNLALALPVAVRYRTRYWATVQAKTGQERGA